MTRAMTGLLFVMLTTPAFAQAPEPDVARIRTALLKEVRLTDSAGQRRSGVLDSIDASELTLLTGDGTVTVPLTAVRRLDRRGDSLWNGILIGASVGVLAVSVTAGEARVGGANVAAYSAFGVGFYALIGAGIDALNNGWTTLSKEEPRKKKHEK